MAVRCLIVAAREDQKFEAELRAQLAVYEQTGELQVVGQYDAPAGAETSRWQARAGHEAELIVLLVSPLLEREEPELVTAALLRCAAGVPVIPVLLKPL